MLPLDKPYIYQGIEYKTSENFYQAMKLPKDRLDLRAEIAAMGSHESKKAIRDKKKYEWRADWTPEESLKVMNYILRIKFAPGTSWATKLLEVKDKEIIAYCNWHDNFWEDCVCEKCADKLSLNHLGKILTSIREELNDSR